VATLLLIDDSNAHRAEIRSAITKAGLFERVLEAADGLSGLRLLLAERVDLVLCDLELPGLDGEKLLAVKSQAPGGEAPPFVFLTASTDLARRARLLEHGASDAIGKPFHPAELVARLALHLKLRKLQSELLLKNATLERLSTLDALTGLRTRHYAMEFLRYELLRARRYRLPLAVMMADLDHFKAINDGFGHLTGDAVLRDVAGLLLRVTRRTDVAARYGGEELLVVLLHNTSAGGRVLAERWRESVAKTRFEGPEGQQARVTVSAGLAELGPEMDGPEALVAAADRALYRAKQNGRNRVEL
jgi:two-component system cell cycle response regulator